MAAEGSALSRSPSGMRRDDDRLKEMLSLARGCLKTGRCPGDPRARDFFDRFNEQDAAVKTAEAEDDARAAEADKAARPITPPPLVDTPENLSPEQRAAKLRRDARDVGRCVADKQKELEAEEREVSREVLERHAANEELRVAKAEFQRAQRSMGEVRDMYKLQEREIQDLLAAIDDVYAPQPTAAELAHAAAQSQLQAQQQRRAAQKAVELDDYYGQLPQLTQLPQQAIAEGRCQSEYSREVVPEVSIEELRSALLRGQRPPAAEAKLWNHLQSENEKLVSVIDAVGELGRQLRTPPSQPSGPTAAIKALAAPRPRPRGPPRQPLAASILGLQAPRPLPAYASVLSCRPSSYKLYM